MKTIKQLQDEDLARARSDVQKIRQQVEAHCDYIYSLLEIANVNNPSIKQRGK